MKKIAFMILPRQDKFEDLFMQSVNIVCDQLLLHFNGCTYYEVKGRTDKEIGKTLSCVKIEIAVPEEDTWLFLQICEFAQKAIGCKQLMVQLPSGEIQFLEEKENEN